MINGFHKHTCSICRQEFKCLVLVACFIEDRYAVCDRPECIIEWDKPRSEED